MQSEMKAQRATTDRDNVGTLRDYKIDRRQVSTHSGGYQEQHLCRMYFRRVEASELQRPCVKDGQEPD